eukprot:scaffold36117_cov146-Isochrysis_galbana.AAC.1
MIIAHAPAQHNQDSPEPQPRRSARDSNASAERGGFVQRRPGGRMHARPEAEYRNRHIHSEHLANMLGRCAFVHNPCICGWDAPRGALQASQHVKAHMSVSADMRMPHPTRHIPNILYTKMQY